MPSESFQQQLLVWYDLHGRKDLPWQTNINPYRIWLSETMLQQTQVATVIPYFAAFTQRFPTVQALASAPIDEVLNLWSGLGYYARARNLHKTAQHIAALGYFPDTLAGLVALPGIGLSTAGAILSIAYQNSHPILDGNVKRVLTRFNAISGWPGESLVTKKLWAVSAEFTPINRVADYTQAIMDLGATLCTRNKPSCTICPVKDGCLAYKNNTVAILPTAKPGKKLPTKQLYFLLLVNEDSQVLLEKRSELGIWGGLWSVPEFTSLELMLGWCMNNNMPVTKQYSLPQKRHTFSHYHLDYTPVLIQTKADFNKVMETGQQLWCTEQHLGKLGLATPIKRLLQQHFKQRGKYG